MSGVAVTYQETRLTRQTRETQARLLQIIDRNAGGSLSLDVVDPQGEVGHVCIYLDEDGHYYAPKGTPDPRNLFARLKRRLRVKRLCLAVRPEKEVPA
jgi:hypothetical protein